jgi:hypothetical protein
MVNTITSINKTISIRKITKPPPDCSKREKNSATKENGRPAMIPTIIKREIPFPIPLSVIFSPNHITNIVPVIKIKTDDIQNKEGLVRKASVWKL